MKTDRVRMPVAAGTFYPGDRGELAAVIGRLLADGAGPTIEGPVPAGVIVPHAGYRYSGPVAATAYALLRPVPRVLLLGPAHFAPLSGCAVPAAAAWATPLGEVPIDPELRDEAVASGAVVDDEPHQPEHSLEVQLPFLQTVMHDGFTVLPVAAGECAPGAVASLIETLGKLADRLVVVSTDLSHYHDAATARRLDRRTADAVLTRDVGAIGPGDACGVFALRGAVEYARRNDLEIRLLDLRNSADTAGDPSRVVGYGAFALSAWPS
jgi:MEMO1 family protein